MWLVVLKVSSTGVQHPIFSNHSLYVAQTSSDLTVVCRVCDRLVQIVIPYQSVLSVSQPRKSGQPLELSFILCVFVCLVWFLTHITISSFFCDTRAVGWHAICKKRSQSILVWFFFYCELENIKVSKPHLFVSMRLSLRVGLRKGSFFLLKSPGDRCSYSFLHMLLPLLFLYLLYVQSIAILFISPPLRHRRPGRQHRQRVERSNLCTWPTGFQCWGPTNRRYPPWGGRTGGVG